MVLVGSKDVFDGLDWKGLVKTTGVTVMGSIINTKREIHNLLDGMIMYHTPKHALSFEMNDMVYTIRPQAFFQLNPYQLVTMVQTIASMMPHDARVFEGYCGIGILGLALHTKIKSLVGVEIIDSAIVDARSNAKRNHIAGYTYYCGDSGTLFRKLHRVEPFDILLLDPPRSGLDPVMIQTILHSGVSTIIYVSCNPVTLAKNLKSLSKYYRVDMVQPLDMFPFTPHVETVVLLSKGEIDSKKVRVEFSLEDMDMSEFQDGATYPQIKEYVLEHTGLKVSNLYISQIKRKCGLEVGKNYNLPKSEDSRQPQCPPEKEKAIREAFKYFGMI